MVDGGRPLGKLVSLIVWLTGVLVSLAVGFGMVDGTLTASTLFIPVVVTQWAGWLVVVLTILSVVLAIAERI